MSGFEEKRKRFELLMKQAELPAGLTDPYFVDGWIERVETNRSNREWHILIYKDTLVPAPIYRTFSLHIQEKMNHIAKITFGFKYTEEQVQTGDIVREYWNLFLEWVTREIPSVNGWMNRASLECEGDLLQLTMSDSTSMELARKKQIDQAITTFYEKYFNLPLRIKLQVGEVGSNREAMEQFQAQKKVEERQVIEQMMSEVTEMEAPEEEEQGDVRLQMGYEIKEPAVPMQEVQDEEKKITLQGSIFGLDRKELRNGNTLFTFYLTDFTDSMQMKMFAKTKEDVRILSLLANGKWVKVRGRVEYDRLCKFLNWL